MPKPSSNSGRAVREPVQVYLAGDDAALLADLARSTGLSKAEILRRGIRSFDREERRESPMLRFLDECLAADQSEVIGEDVDAVLAEEYRRPDGARSGT